MAVAAVVVRDRGLLELLAWLLRPGVLAVVAAVNLLIAGWRLAAALHAWQVARPGRGRPAGGQLAGLAVVAVVLIVAPHAAVGLGAMQAQQVLDAVFVAPAAGEVGAVGSEPPARLGETPEAGSDPPATDEEGSEPAVTTDRLTMLLLGSDAGPDRTGTRIDAMVVASIEVETGAVTLISVARNLAEVPLSGEFAERLGARFAPRLMSLYPAAAGDAVLAAEFGDAGSAAHVNVAETLLEVDIDHVVRVDLAGFIDLIDALGGVTVEVDAPIQVRLSPPREGGEWRTYDIAAGRQRLDGDQAHAYVRSRTGSDDYDRMRRQRCLLASAAAEIDTTRLLARLPAIVGVLGERVRTDIPTDQLPGLVRLAGRIDISALRTLGLTPLDYADGRTPDGFFRADVAAIQTDVAALLAGKHDAAPAATADLEDTCG